MPPSKTDTSLTWGAGVKALRGLHNITQVQLAEQADTSQVTISRIELGARQISDSLRLRIARALNTDPYALFPYLDDEQAESA